MPFSVIENKQFAEIEEKVRRIQACEKVAVVAKKGGGNSVVYCTEIDDNRWAVKSYPPYAPGKRDRLIAESMAYEFLNDHDVPAVPHMKLYSDTERLLVMDWIEGEIPSAYTSNDIQQAIAFIDSIAKLNTLETARKLPKAAEACLSLNIIIGQVEKRYQRLVAVSDDEPELHAFLEREFLPLLEKLTADAREGYIANKMDPDGYLSIEKRSLIPADFGFHNAIRDHDNKLHFFDFDYFGWDDPVKLLVDILWHPKMDLTEKQSEQFIAGIANVFSHDATFMTRFNYTLPLFGMRWALILLNEFVPEFWQNRQHADVHASHKEAKLNQLNLAKALLQNVIQIGCKHENIAATSI